MDPVEIRRERESRPNELLPDLRGWQIFFILASVIIGEGIFSGDREALEVAGPGGTLLALFLVGGLAICVMSCVSELVQLFPVPNAIVEYIKAFVDEDLAWCCGVAYWYTWTSVFVALYYTAVNFTQYWGLPQLWHNVIFGVAPVAILAINMLGVNLFGIVETVGGFLKLVLVFGVGIAMYVVHSQPPGSEQPSPIYDGFEANDAFVTSPVVGVFWVIPTMAYSFLGVESVCITAFEARDVHSLRNPSRWIAWVILFLYAFTLIAEFLVFSWTNPNLPAIYGSDKNSTPAGANSGKLAMAVVALENAGHPMLASFVNAGCVFSAMSASNAALYIASRSLYGLARNTPTERTTMSRIFNKFSHTTDTTRVPALALFGSTIAFVWLPFLSNVQNGDTVQLVFDILSGTASVMCLIVWAALCAALLRFRRWFGLCRNALEEGYERYDRQRTAKTHVRGPRPQSQPRSAATGTATAVDADAYSTASTEAEPALYGARTGLMFLQPGLAWIGMIGSLLVVLVLSTVQWWNDSFTGQKFAIAYTAPLAIIVLWPVRKVWAHYMHAGHRGWVRLDSDPVPLTETLNRLQCAIPEKQERGWQELLEIHPWLKPLDQAMQRTRKARDGPAMADNGNERGIAVSHDAAPADQRHRFFQRRDDMSGQTQEGAYPMDYARQHPDLLQSPSQAVYAKPDARGAGLRGEVHELYPSRETSTASGEHRQVAYQEINNGGEGSHHSYQSNQSDVSRTSEPEMEIAPRYPTDFPPGNHQYPNQHEPERHPPPPNSDPVIRAYPRVPRSARRQFYADAAGMEAGNPEVRPAHEHHVDHAPQLGVPEVMVQRPTWPQETDPRSRR